MKSILLHSMYYWYLIIDSIMNYLNNFSLKIMHISESFIQPDKFVISIYGKLNSVIIHKLSLFQAKFSTKQCHDYKVCDFSSSY